MFHFPVHTFESAPDASQVTLQTLRKRVGMIPNLAAAMSESPQLLSGFLAIREIFYAGTFDQREIQVLALTNAVENGCEYCVALHSAFALKEGVSRGTVAALRTGAAPSEPKLRALSDLSRSLLRSRGHAGADELSAFEAAGYSRAQALEVVLGVAVSILPNYAHHLTKCPLDDAFRAHAWVDPRA